MMLTDNTQTNNRKPPLSFYLGWVGLTAINIPVAWTIATVIIKQIVQVVGGTIQVGGQRRVTEDFIAGFVFMPMLGLLIGVVQYFLLRGYLPRTAGWIAATVLGWLLPLGLLFVASLGWFPAPSLDPISTGAVAFAVIGACIGLCQWWVLRGRVPRAGLWVLINVLGWTAAGLAVGEVISSQTDVIAIALLPPAATSIGWWLLLDRLPAPEGKI